MQCNTNYENKERNFDYLNLNVIKEFKKTYKNLIIGLSDHTKGYEAVIAAIALGAKVIEKHFTDDDRLPGPDHAFAMTPSEWKNMVDKSRLIERAMGDGIKKIEENEKGSFIVQRRGVYINKDIKSGATITSEDLDYLRPLEINGFHPYEKDKIIGKKLISSKSMGNVLLKDDLR